MTDASDRVTSAVLARSLSWDVDVVRATPPRRRRALFANEAMVWQQVSQRGSWAEMRAQVPQRNFRSARPEANRLVELHGLMGAIGEQAALCWTTEQDAQRFGMTGSNRMPEHHRLVLRALAEGAAHFLLGATHSLGNLGVRLALLNPLSATYIRGARRKAQGFPPGGTDRHQWLTLYDCVKVLTAGVDSTRNKYLARIVAVLEGLQSDHRFRTLDTRRGMDYHRHRPQSVPHASPKAGTVSTNQDGVTQISMVGASLDPEADAEAVHRLLIDAMEPLRAAMRDVRREMPRAIRRERIVYHERLGRPTRAWTSAPRPEPSD